MVDYIKHIDVVAASNASVPYETKLLKTWQEFEEYCQTWLPIPYDVLHNDVGPDFLKKCTDFIKLLYENGDNDPQQDCDQIREKDAAYGGSWHKRGGTGAYHAMARKGDRLMSMLAKHKSLANCRSDKTNSEHIDDTIGDLRRYLILFVSWHWKPTVVHLDGPTKEYRGSTASEMRLVEANSPPATIKEYPASQNARLVPRDTHTTGPGNAPKPTPPWEHRAEDLCTCGHEKNCHSFSTADRPCDIMDRDDRKCACSAFTLDVDKTIHARAIANGMPPSGRFA